jgi:voltage-gated potassium channel
MSQQVKRHPITKSLIRLLLIDLLFDPEARPVFGYAAGTIVAGTVAFHYLEGWGWLDALYFVVITTTTIGFGDLTPSRPLTKIVTIVFALNGIAIILLLLDQIRRSRSEMLSPRRQGEAHGGDGGVVAGGDEPTV